ncbi:helix-turn-helix domain-containing protein, partial [Brevibacterium epidermidis]|uniref:helix-turn-helix domain-containing protein n=1 Tax=Brevibacterium epidermidis TaxID=1698 RepID=UPI001300019F
VYQRKLTDEDVQACRAMVDMGISVAEVARRYEVSRQALYNAVEGAGAYSPTEKPAYSAIRSATFSGGSTVASITVPCVCNQASAA